MCVSSEHRPGFSEKLGDGSRTARITCGNMSRCLIWQPLRALVSFNANSSLVFDHRLIAYP